MVSRGGRSKGCSNCRRRRIKCDETRPACQRCQKRGLSCDGPRDLTWINESQTTPPEQGEAQILIPTVPGELSLTAFKGTLCLTYTRKHLLRGGPVELACNTIFMNSNTHSGIDLLKDAIMSLSTTFYGSQHHQNTIMNNGYHQYGRVLKRLNDQLTEAKHRTADETLLTALTCMLLEIFLPTGPNHYLRHMQGIESILEMRGPPQMPCSKNTLVLYHGLRILSIICGLAMSRQSIYSKSEWRQIPNLHMDEPGRLRYRIFDILADCTRLMSEKDAAMSSQDPVYRLSLLSEAEVLLQDLESIYPQWSKYNEEQMKISTSGISQITYIANHHSATVHMLYNTAYIFLIDLMNALSPIDDYKDLRNAAAIKIMKSLELKLYEQRTGVPESNTVGFVFTRVAWQALGGFDSPEGQHLTRTVQKAMKGVLATDAWVESSARQLPTAEPTSDVQSLQKPKAVSLNSASTPHRSAHNGLHAFVAAGVITRNRVYL